MRILLIGGSGIISSAVARLALDKGFEVDVLVRGKSAEVRPLPQGVTEIRGDVRDVSQAAQLLSGKSYDTVIDFVAFRPEHVDLDLALFEGKTKQLIFISSASVYHKPVRQLPILESTPLHNPFWAYARDKIACEERALAAYQNRGFPVTIVRPSHTYDRTLFPFSPHGSGATVFSRILNEQPVIMHGDGTSLWVMTHHKDFAVGLLGLCGNPRTLGETFHITCDFTLTWNEIFEQVAAAVNRPLRLVHVPSTTLARYDAEWGASLLGDKAHSVIFDNAKIRRFVPEFAPKIQFHEGVLEVVEYHQRMLPALGADAALHALFDRIASEQS